jgi:hypothetical protein
MAFPNTQLPVKVEIALAADLTASYASWSWTDIVALRLVRVADLVVITRGRGDRFSQTPPSTCRLTVFNTDGRWCRTNPTGAWYGQLAKNTPLRVRVDGGGGYVTRFTGFIDELPAQWDKSGRYAVANLTASGLLRRVQQGSVLRSALYRSVTSELYSAGSVVGYWPCEDPSGSVSVASGVGGPAGQVSATGVSMAADSAVVGSAPLPTLAAGGFINGNVPPYSTSSTWAARWLFKVPTAAAGTTHLGWINTTGDPGSWALYLYPDNTLHLQAWRAGADVLADAGQPFQDASGLPLTNRQIWVAVNATQNGTGVDWRWTVYSASYTWTGAGNVASSTVGQVSSIGAYGNGSFVGGTYGHIVVGTDTSFIDETAAVTGKANDATFQRLSALCAEENIGVTYVGTPFTGMGPQPVASLIDQIREVEATEESRLYEGTDGRLVLWDRRELANQTVALTLSRTAGQWSEPPEVVDDDRDVRNDISVTRPGAVQGARATDVAHARAHGVYADSATVNVWQDSDLPDHASWRLHLGTLDELRYPRVTMNFAAPGMTSKITDWLATDIGERLQLTNPPTQLPPDTIDLMLEGYTETLGPKTWLVVANCSPYRPWETFALEDTRLGRLDTAGSTLAAAITTTTQTSLSVATSTLPLWTTTGTPFDIEIGGERMTATAISGTSSPQTFTVTRSVNGVVKTHPSGASVTVWHPGVLSL